MALEPRPPESTRPSLWHSVRMVAWGFLGIRKKSGFEEDLKKVSPLHVIAVGLVAVAAFVGVLILIVHQVVAA